MGVFPEARSLIETGIQKVYAGEMSVQEALDEAAEKTTESILEWNELIQ